MPFPLSDCFYPPEIIYVLHGNQTYALQARWPHIQNEKTPRKEKRPVYSGCLDMPGLRADTEGLIRQSANVTIAFFWQIQKEA